MNSTLRSAKQGCRVPIRLVISAALLAVLLVGCATPASDPNATAQLTGSVTFPEPISLPTAARLHLSLIEIPSSPGSGESRPLAQSTQPTGPAFPIPFELPFNPADIRPAAEYRLIAQITVQGTMWFSNILTPARITPAAPTTNVDEISLRREAALR